MAQWGKNDAASNSAVFAPGNLNKTPNTANRDALFGNTTADAYFTGATIGQYGVSKDEVRAARAAGSNEKTAGPGWVLRTEGSGGRSGRVQTELLVAVSSLAGDATDDTTYPDFVIQIVTQPSDASANSAGDEQATFTVVAASVPPGANINYTWEWADAGNTDLWDYVNATAGFANSDTDTLTVDANTISDGTLLRVTMYGDGAANVTSDTVTLTVTS